MSELKRSTTAVSWWFGERPGFQLDAISAMVIAVMAVVARVGVGERAWDFVAQVMVFVSLAALIKPRLYRFYDERGVKFQPLVAHVLFAAIATAIVAGLSWLVSLAAELEPLPRLVLGFDFALSAGYLVVLRRFASRWSCYPASPGDATPPRREEEGRGSRDFVLAFMLIFIFGMALGWKALGYPMAWDDLHLIRPFSATNMADALSGNWDPDRIETDGYRPFTLLFNHVRFALFGENVVGQRMFLIGMYALFLSMLGWVARQFGMPWKFAMLAAALSMAARHNIYHYVWLVDGIHLLQGVLLAAALVCVVKLLQGRGNVYFVYAAVLCAANLLTREDSVVALAIVPLVGFGYVLRESGWGLRAGGLQSAPTANRDEVRHIRYRQLGSLTIVLLVIGAAYFYARAQAVPNAEGTALQVQSLVNVVESTALGFMGRQSFDAISVAGQIAWLAVLGLTLGAAAWLGIRERNLVAAYWLLPAAVACLVGLSNDRVNLLLFPITFFAFFLAAAWWQLEKSAVLRPVVTALAVIGILGAAYVSTVAMEAFHAQSATVVYWNAEFIFGRYAGKATIPEAREQGAAAALLQLGINSADDIPATYQEALTNPGTELFSRLVQAALAADRRRPDGKGLFVPWLEPLGE